MGEGKVEVDQDSVERRLADIDELTPPKDRLIAVSARNLHLPTWELPTAQPCGCSNALIYTERETQII